MFGLFTTFVTVFNITLITIRYNWKRGKFEFDLMTWEPSARTIFNSVELNGKYGKMVNPTRMFAHAPTFVQRESSSKRLECIMGVFSTFTPHKRTNVSGNVQNGLFFGGTKWQMLTNFMKHLWPCQYVRRKCYNALQMDSYLVGQVIRIELTVAIMSCSIRALSDYNNFT